MARRNPFTKPMAAVFILKSFSVGRIFLFSRSNPANFAAARVCASAASLIKFFGLDWAAFHGLTADNYAATMCFYRRRCEVIIAQNTYIFSCSDPYISFQLVVGATYLKRSSRIDVRKTLVFVSYSQEANRLFGSNNFSRRVERKKRKFLKASDIIP